MYSTDTGVYKEHCGLAAVHMSWSASEYLYMVRPSCGHHVPLAVCAPASSLDLHMLFTLRSVLTVTALACGDQCLGMCRTFA